jgi:hypothetical protein
MAYITDYAYYTNNGTAPTDVNQGSYQYVSLADIVNNFMLIYVGNDKEINNVERYNVLFHAKRGIQEFNYDAMKTINVVEQEIGDDLKMVMPPDYVNWVRISMNIDGELYPLSENRQAISAVGYLQDNNLDLLFDANGELMTGDSKLDIVRLSQSLYDGPGLYNGCMGWCVNDTWYFPKFFGADPSVVTAKPEFRVNNKSGVIDFTSGFDSMYIVLEYISDGMENGDDTKVGINKLAEEFLYAYIRWAILDSKAGIPDYVKRRVQKEKTAKWRNSKIRTSNLHASRLMKTLRGQNAQIK